MLYHLFKVYYIYTCVVYRLNVIFYKQLQIKLGPPGTGKTKTAIELINLYVNILKLKHNVLKLDKYRKPTIATAFTNTGVDQLLIGLMNKGLKVLRIGFPVKMNAQVRNVGLSTYIEKHKMKITLNDIKAKIEDIDTNIKERKSKRKQMHRANKNGKYTTSIHSINDQIESMMKNKTQLNEQYNVIHKDMINDILMSVDVICATCIGSGSELFVENNLEFPLIVIDEASQTIEPAVLIPIINSSKNNSRLVLIGDQKQLPPTINNVNAKNYGLDKTLFDRLIEKFSGFTKLSPSFPLMKNNLLSIQYRMHPHISQWPNKMFYDNKIENACNERDFELFNIPGFNWPMMKSDNYYEVSPLLFINCNGIEHRRDDGSISNELEAIIVVKLLMNIIDSVKMNIDNTNFIDSNKNILNNIGIITGYNYQVSKIKEKLMHIYGDNNPLINCIEISSVDGYQGREKELIILSCVRNNNYNDIGFLNDERRLNVALTRAKSGLIIIGNSNTLSCNYYWRNFINELSNTNRMIDENNLELIKYDHNILKNLFLPETTLSFVNKTL